MAERVLVPYDASFCADRAVEHALQLAHAWNASLYVVALASAHVDGPAAGNRLMDDLIAFAHLGRRLGVEVDGSFLESPSTPVLKQLMASHRIDHLVVAVCKGAADSDNARLIQSLAQDSPVPVTTLEIQTP